MTRDDLLRLQGAARTYRERFDLAYQSWGMRAPAPSRIDSVGDVIDYRRRMAADAKLQLPRNGASAREGDPTFAELRALRYRTMDDDVYERMEPMLLRAVTAAGKRNDSIPATDPARAIHERGPNGEYTIRYLGERSFVHDFKAPVRRVLGFRTEHGFVDTTGAMLR
jgi:hypothetical protein